MRRIPSPRRARAPRRGFTLVEVMVSLAVLVVIGTLAFIATKNAIDLRDWLEREDETDRSARVTMAKLTRELRLAFLTENTTAVNTYQTVFIGQDGDDADTVWFATMAHLPTTYGAAECDQAEITVWTQEDPNNDDALLLLHRESPRIDQVPDEQGAILPLASNVKRFDLRYLDPTTNEWRDDWDSTGIDTPGRIPRAVQILLVLYGPDPEDRDKTIERPYITTVLIERASRLTRSALASDGG